MPWFSFHFADFAFSFLSILFEGVPFLLLGAVISGLVEVFVPSGWLARVLPKNPTAAIFLSGLLGGIFPMCECGSVIVIRRFLAKGMPVSCAVAYMLGAPIVSPLVALSTFAAFRGQSPWVMTSMRLLLGYCIAVGAALVVQRLPLQKVLQRKVIDSLPEGGGGGGDEQGMNDAGIRKTPKRSGLRIAPGNAIAVSEAVEAPVTGQGGDGFGPGRVSKWFGMVRPVWVVRLVRLIRLATADFLDVALFFVIGAAIAATFNTAVDQSVILPLADNHVLATAGMMAFAGVLALCSSTDAFIAASFTAFPFTSKLAFLVFGPLFDVKLFFLYGVVFRRRFIVLLAIGLFIAVGLICLRMSVLDV